MKLANGVLAVKGAKKGEKEEKRKECHVSECRAGAFERHFTSIPTKSRRAFGTTYKTPEAQKAEKKIVVKTSLSLHGNRRRICKGVTGGEECEGQRPTGTAGAR